MSYLFLSGIVLLDAPSDHSFFVDYLQVITGCAFGTLVMTTANTSWAPFASAPWAFHSAFLQNKACVGFENCFGILSGSAFHLAHSLFAIGRFFGVHQLVDRKVWLLIANVAIFAFFRFRALGASILYHGIRLIEGWLVTSFTGGVHQSKIIHTVKAFSGVTWSAVGWCAFCTTIVFIFKVPFLTNGTLIWVINHRLQTVLLSPLPQEALLRLILKRVILINTVHTLITFSKLISKVLIPFLICHLSYTFFRKILTSIAARV